MADRSISHWGIFTGVMISPSVWLPCDFEPFPFFEGPAYADRVKGRLTYLDYDGWLPEDKKCWPLNYKGGL